MNPATQITIQIRRVPCETEIDGQCVEDDADKIQVGTDVHHHFLVILQRLECVGRQRGSGKYVMARKERTEKEQHFIHHITAPLYYYILYILKIKCYKEWLLQICSAHTGPQFSQSLPTPGPHTHS